MTKTYNGRFSVPSKPKSGTGWLIFGIILMLGGPPGIVFGCLSLAKYGKCRRACRMHDRFLEYCAVIGMRSRVSFRELAKCSNRTSAEVRQDLQTMIAKGYFGNCASLDVNGGYLLLTDVKSGSANWMDALSELIRSVRRDFGIHVPAQKAPVQNVEKEFHQEKTEAKEPPRETPKPAEPAKRTYMEELERTLNELYQLNIRIEDENVSRRIDRIGELTGGIFRAVIENPAREAEVRKFMNYYLPTTLKLLKSYDLMENQSYQGENIAASRKKIENVLDMLIEAYEKQLDRLFSDDALDIATDIDVLETMMAGDGLSSKGTLKL